MKKTNDIKTKMLTDEQAAVVRTMIIDSMRGIWVESVDMSPDMFFKAAHQITEKIIQNVQMSLLQSATFEKIVKNSKPLRKTKTKKVAKKVVKKVKKHARR